jgi:hypothetical protein
MKRLTGAFLVSAMLALAGCGGGGGGDSAGPATRSDVVTFAAKMINEATAEDCPTQEHCIPWPVDSLAALPDEELPPDL